MAGNHVSQLSPRQRMINMMYLVLTALLALNVSKKVLDSFFKVDKSLTQTVLEKHTKNQERYEDFAAKADKNPTKIGRWNDLAQQLNLETQKAFSYIDSIRYVLWSVNKPSDPFNSKKSFDFEDEKYKSYISNKSLYELHSRLGGVPEIMDKQNYQRSTDILIKKENPEGKILVKNLSDYKQTILGMDVFPLTDSTYHREINNLFKFDPVKEDGKDFEQEWYKYKFEKIPVVAVLTFLNQLALDVVTAEDKMLTLLEQKTGSSIVSIDRQIPYGLPKKAYLNTGDNLEMSMLLMGIDTKTKPTYDIYELDLKLRNPTPGVQYNNPLPKGTKIDSIVTINRDSSRTVEYKFTIDPQYKINKEPINANFDGMGEWSKKMGRSGKQWIGGVITVVSDIEEDGKLEYPWATEIVVEQAMSVVSATNLKALYVGVTNDFTVAVPGYSPSDLTLKSDYSGIKISKKGKGKFTVTVKKGVGKTVKLWVSVKGKGKVGDVATYTIYPLAPPLISFNGGRPSGEYSVDNLRKLTKVQAKTDPSFIYDLQYQIKSCKVSWQKQDGTGVTKTLKRGGFKPIQTVLSNARPGQIFTFTNMKVNVFENKKKVDEQSIKTSLSITVK